MSCTLVVTGGESELNNPSLNTTFGLSHTEYVAA